MVSQDEEKKPIIPPGNTGYGTIDAGGDNASTSTNSTGGLSAKRPEQIESQPCLHHPRVDSSSGCLACLPTSTLVVENKGSTARDFCAIERNFLAWVRLSTMLIVTGFSIFFHFVLILPDQKNHKPDQGPISENLPSTIISAALVFFGFLTLLWAFVQFFHFHSQIVERVVAIEHGKWSFFITFTVAAIIYAALLIERIRLDERPDGGLDGESTQFQNLSSTLLLGLF